jgi:hypothetical protein
MKPSSPLLARRRVGPRFRGFRALVVCALFFVVIGWPPRAAAQSHDYTIGHISEPDGRKIDFSAHRAADGSNVFGHVTLNFRPDENVSEHFEVTCLVTLGNESVISGIISHVAPPTFPTAVAGVVVWANDNDALGTPDTYDYVLTLAPPPCLVPSPVYTPVLQGGISVFDAVP